MNPSDSKIRPVNRSNIFVMLSCDSSTHDSVCQLSYPRKLNSGYEIARVSSETDLRL